MLDYVLVYTLDGKQPFMTHVFNQKYQVKDQSTWTEIVKQYTGALGVEFTDLKIKAKD